MVWGGNTPIETACTMNYGVSHFQTTGRTLSMCVFIGTEEQFRSPSGACHSPKWPHDPRRLALSDADKRRSAKAP